MNQCNERLCIETSNRWTIFLYCGKNRNDVGYLYWVFSKEASTSTLPALKNITSVINYLTEKMVQTCIVTFHNRGRDPLRGPKDAQIWKFTLYSYEVEKLFQNGEKRITLRAVSSPAS